MESQLIQGLGLSVVGVATVFVALIVTGLLVDLIGRTTRDKPKPVVAKSGNVPEVDLAGKIDKKRIVLLAAAASIAAKRPVRIRRIRFVTHKHIPSSWAAAGRSDHVHESLD